MEKGYIIDGFPRNLEQAKEYDKILERLGYDIGKVILLDVEKDVLEKRITGRRVCKDCNATYNINDKDNCPKEESICDKCGGPLYQREDDNINSFNNRYDTYLEKTSPLIDYYKKKKVLYKIDGSSSVEKISKGIEKIVKGN